MGNTTSLQHLHCTPSCPVFFGDPAGTEYSQQFRRIGDSGPHPERISFVVHPLTGDGQLDVDFPWESTVADFFAEFSMTLAWADVTLPPSVHLGKFLALDGTTPEFEGIVCDSYPPQECVMAAGYLLAYQCADGEIMLLDTVGFEGCGYYRLEKTRLETKDNIYVAPDEDVSHVRNKMEIQVKLDEKHPPEALYNTTCWEVARAIVAHDVAGVVFGLNGHSGANLPYWCPLVPLISPIIAHAHHLEVVNMQSCALDYESLRHLCRALISQQNVTTLYLRGNRFDDRCVALLVCCLLQCRQVANLALYNNPFGTEGCVSLRQLVLEHPRLDWLDIGECALTLDDVRLIIDGYVARPSTHRSRFDLECDFNNQVHNMHIAGLNTDPPEDIENNLDYWSDRLPGSEWE